jgi:uncharacterized protein YkwD
MDGVNAVKAGVKEMASVYSLISCFLFASLSGCTSLAQEHSVTAIQGVTLQPPKASQPHQLTETVVTPGEIEGSDAHDLADVERQVIWHLNLVRRDPARYAREFVEPRLKFFAGTLYLEPGSPANFAGIETEEGIAAVQEAVRVLKATPPRPALTASHGLSLAAADHARDQSATGLTGHGGSDGSTMQIRVGRYGQWQRALGENIVYGADNARDMVVELLIDDGVPGRGHRKSILNPDFDRVGVAITTHPQYGHICVIDFAAGFLEGR